MNIKCFPKDITNLCYSYMFPCEKSYIKKKWDNFNKTDVFEIAAKYNWLDLMKWAYVKYNIYTCNYHIDKSICDEAAKYGSLEILKHLIKNGVKYNECTMFNATKGGHFETIEYLHNISKGKWITDIYTSSSICEGAVEGGHLEILKYLIGNGYFCGYYGYVYAVKNNDFEMLKYLYESKKFDQAKLEWIAHNYQHEMVRHEAEKCRIAAKNGNLEMLKYLCESFFKDEKETEINNEIIYDMFRGAAEGGHIEILKYLYEKYEKDIFNNNNTLVKCAARNNHLNTFKYIIEKGCKLDNTIFYCAIEKNNLQMFKYLCEECLQIKFVLSRKIIESIVLLNSIEILTYLHKNSSNEWDSCCSEYASDIAAENGNLLIFKYLYENSSNAQTANCKYDCMCSAAENNKIEIIKYLHEKGYKNKCACEFAYYKKHRKLLAWLKNNGCMCNGKYHKKLW